MRKDIITSCIAVPVPTDLYVSMRDLLSTSNMECGPALMVPSILQEPLDGAGIDLRRQRGNAKAPSPA
jgi:hypothetical protein